MTTTPRATGERQETDTLRLGLSILPNASYTATHFPLRVTFTNDGERPVRLLNQFEPLPVFFSFSLIRPDETPIAVSGGGKADFPDGMLTYLDLPPHDTFALTVDLAELLPPDTALPSGAYAVAVSYHNQYGERCFQGRLRSRTIEVSVDG